MEFQMHYTPPLLGPCSTKYDGSASVPITRARAAYLLRAARSRGSVAPALRTGRHCYRIGGFLTLMTLTWRAA